MAAMTVFRPADDPSPARPTASATPDADTLAPRRTGTAAFPAGAGAAPSSSSAPSSTVGFAPDRDTRVDALANGVRIVTIRMPWLDSAAVTVFVRTGSRDENIRQAGISHVVEHMAFKGTRTRTGDRINLDAERLGAEVNAHTDKDHTAYHMRGLARHAGDFVRMLADIVREGVYPADELERERQVILHEFTEDDEDPLSNAFRLFDAACFGAHPMARPVIGLKRNIERFTREELLAYVGERYGAVNVIVGVAGDIDPDAIVREVESAFGDMPSGTPNASEPPAWHGGIRTRRLPGCSQSHVVLGWPIPTLRDDPEAAILAAALLGEGMSSPLMQEIREKRALCYYAACSADVWDQCGQFVVEASTSPKQVDELAMTVDRLMREQIERTQPVDFERARNQIAVRRLRSQESPFRRLEDAAQDLYVHGRLRSSSELAARLEAVTTRQVRQALEGMRAWPASVAVAGSLPAGTRERMHALFPQP
jgi:predicted Zn-dependent peptidase